MRVLRASLRNIRIAAETVKLGGLVVYPTDTVYGLGCDPFNIEAVKRVFRVKGEERKKPLPILASDVQQVKKIAQLTEEAEKVAERFWPGPLTIVVPKKPTLPRIVTCNTDSVGVRVPKHNSALQLIRLSGGLLVGTSANKTGKEPPKSAQKAVQQLGEEVDIILDGGLVPLGVSSSVIDFTSTKPKLLRKGPIKLSDLQVERLGYRVKYVPHRVIADYNATYNVMYRGQHVITGAARKLKIPLNEIWISEMWRPYEKYILHHEIHEIRYRAEGLRPESAHKKTSEDEFAKWKNDALWQKMVKEIRRMDRITAETKFKALRCQETHRKC